MNFIYSKYEHLLDSLKEKKYCFCNYANHEQFQKAVILRHDVDFSLEKALKFAELENCKSIPSTYFVLLATNFYNIFSKKSYEILKEIKNMGHEIGLHFDEKRYDIANAKEIEYWVKKEIDILECAIDEEIKVVSMHRPSKCILENDIQFEKVINTYSKLFIGEFKYLSDSRMHWRENVLNIIQKESYDKLHILTHPFWYSNKEETMRKKLIDFINHSKSERYDNIKDNFRDLEEVLRVEEL
ncbi:hypothetical protein [Lutispora sp.]|uniref:hypothetical protein n=1 Tax=Lutispora sp. TaxID=2828727 RepID=UPI002B1FF611|nr:hypothetical protein [Lutispora sp.]MEA4964001.1 hypothetical protein [Lutispora sp.]